MDITPLNRCNFPGHPPDPGKVARMLGVDMATAHQVHALMDRAFRAGFDISGEGGNAEYPYGDKGIDPESDDWWVQTRSHALNAIVDEFSKLW